MYCRWYRRDDNYVPPMYVLLSISHHLPDFTSDDKDKKKAAKETWWKESDDVQEALIQAAQKVFDVEKTRQMTVSGILF